MVVVILIGGVVVETFTSSESLSPRNTLEGNIVSVEIWGNEDRRAVRTRNSNQNMIFYNISSDVIEVTSGKSGHDKFNISTNFSSNLGKVSLDIVRWRVYDTFELTGTDLAGIVN